MISVYRIYFGRALAASGMVDELVGLFDRLPNFLHSGCTLPPAGTGIEAVDAAAREAAVKIAMTQCHVALVWGGDGDPEADWTRHELSVARSAFRRPIPVLAVVPDGCQPSGDLAQMADGVIGWSAPEIARAIVGLAETAAEQRHLGREGTGAALSRSSAVADANAVHTTGPDADQGHERPLPIVEIVAAYHRLRLSREGGSPAASPT